MKRYFITSTGTGIGKTFITRALVRQAKALGKTALALKPVISGFDENELERLPLSKDASDTSLLLQAMDRTIARDSLNAISPFRYHAPLAPSMAARREGRSLSLDALLKHTGSFADEATDFLFIEGVGGVMVPLTDDVTVLDWIEALKMECFLVTGTYLGCLSHTLTALSVLAMRKICVGAVVINASQAECGPNDIHAHDIADELARFTNSRLLILARHQTPDDAHELRALLT